MLRQAEQVNERAAPALEQTLRTNFADGDGRLPRTLERFLGDRGALRSMVDELFDETKRDSAIGRIGGDARALFRRRRVQARAPARPDPPQLADAPVPPGDHGRASRASRSASSPSRRPPPHAAPSAPGRRPRAPTSRSCSRRCSARSPAAPATCSTGRGSRPARLKSKKGDFVADRRPAGRARLRPAGRGRGEGPADVRCGRCATSCARPARTAARPSRSRSSRRPTPRPGIAPFTMVGDDVYCVIDPEAPEPATLEAAIRLARLLALATPHRARGRDRRGGDRHGADRHPRAARGRASAQVAADLDLERDEGRLDRPRHDARDDPGPRQRGRGRDPRRQRLMPDRVWIVRRDRSAIGDGTTGYWPAVGGGGG